MGGDTGLDSAEVIVESDSSERVLRGLSLRPASKLRLLEALAPPPRDVEVPAPMLRSSTDLP